MAEQRQSNIFYYCLIFLLMGYLLSSNVIYAANLEGIVFDSGYDDETETMNYSKLPYPDGDQSCSHNEECGDILRYCEQDYHYSHREGRTFSPDNTYTYCSWWETFNHILRVINDGCVQCEFTHQPDSWQSCFTQPYYPSNPPVLLRAGTVNYTLCYDPTPWQVSEAQQCGISLTQKIVGARIDSGDSSHTFVIDCVGDRVAKLLRVESNARGHRVTITSEGPLSGSEFQLNGYPPSEIYPTSYEEFSCYNDFVNTWHGNLVWEIPINKRCGDSITLTPSLTTGHGHAGISNIKAISKCIFDPEN